MRGQKEITSQIRNAFYDANMLAMTQGVEVDPAGIATVYKREDGLKVTDNLGTLEVTIKATPSPDKVILRNSDGDVAEVDVTTGKATVPALFAKEGDILSGTYQEEVTGGIITLDSDKFAKAFEMQMTTIAYDPSDNSVHSYIHIQLDHVVPKGQFELSLENGSAVAPQFDFDVLVAPNTTEFGRIIEEPVK